MSLISELQRILDLPDPRDEARRKLRETYMFVNGKLMYIRDFSWEHGVLIAQLDSSIQNIPDADIERLDVFLPESGLYPINGTSQAVLLVKLPKRQWLKSMSMNFYKRKIVGEGSKPYKKDQPVFDMDFSKCSDFFVDGDKNIWYWEFKVGKLLDGNKIQCVDQNFKQELIDWRKRCL